MQPYLAIVLVFAGCCSNVVFLEYLVSSFPGSGNIITFSQFLFIAVEGFIFTSKFGTKKSAIPIKQYIFMVCFFFVVQVLNNYAFTFNISMPLQMIFRAGSLMASLTLGVMLKGRQYTKGKYVSVTLITIGIIMCTIASSQVKESVPSNEGEDLYSFTMWTAGIVFLTTALFLSAGMGLFQESVYSKYGKHPREALFFNHALPLPGFLLLMNNIKDHALLFNQTEHLELIAGITVPRMWFFLAANVLTQYVCIRSVFVLTTECKALTVTLVVTLRKFVSLLFSIWYFENEFTLVHWLGSMCVFLGTLMFTEVIPLPAALAGQPLSEKDKKK
ncbi:UDP-xylose and UDP-N-acetylglucosamine transporter-like [Ylistrum balloti]|uniref:UDP-xylose and UDP-N-acetylglucosamine transporter-like n=1 Tax=Ylistrum balloti TaxID=509963 RepID=UPI002905B310|nr:UDP-xylose and UDP-N-acetylglucosamine transporter-like [Ylistrum balloti]